MPDGGPRACQAWRAVGNSCDYVYARCDPRTGFCPDAGQLLCTALFPDGTACASPDRCASKYCNSNSRVDGGPRQCGYVAEGGRCGALLDCAAGTYCKGFRLFTDGGRVTGACTTRVASDAGCTNEDLDDGCLDPAATCLDGICQVAELSRPLGAECDGLYQCADDGYCPTRNKPNQTAACSARLDAGAVCWSGYADTDCAAGTLCDLSTNRCVRRLAAGQGPCANDLQCQDMTWCVGNRDGGSDVCFPDSVLGERCSQNLGIACLGSVCVRDGGVEICAALFPDGHACGSDFDCDSARCASGACWAACF